MELPPELLSLGVVDFGVPAVPGETIDREPGAGLGAPSESIVPEAAAEAPAQKPRRAPRARKTAKKGKADAPETAAGAGTAAAKAKRRRPPRGRAKKPAATGGEG
jgi:hypothetical protein